MTAVLHDADLFRVRLPLATPFRAAHGTTAMKEALLLRVRTDAGTGWGECAAPVSPEYAPDTIDGARLVLRDHLLPRVFAGHDFDDVRGHSAARAALECALLDAQLRGDGIALAKYLGGTRPFVDAGVAVGLTDDVDELRRVVAGYVAQGYRRVKCKIEPGHDRRVVDAAHAETGAGVELAADANGSYSLAEAVDRLDDMPVRYVEQPLAADELLDHQTLAATIRTRICLDESITTARGASAAISMRACHVVSVKPGRLGLAEATRVHHVCVAAQVPAFAGGLLETGVGRAQLLAVASLPGFELAGDCSASERYFGPDGDLTEPFLLEDGQIRVPTGPGLGVEPLADRLPRVTIAREHLTKD